VGRTPGPGGPSGDGPPAGFSLHSKHHVISRRADEGVGRGPGGPPHNGLLLAVVLQFVLGNQLAQSAFELGHAARQVLVSLKDAVRAAFDERQKLGLPSPLDAEPWWCDYERHVGPRPAVLPEHP